jgi:ParB family transcriptional regulator, chromosome partitioning protein
VAAIKRKGFFGQTPSRPEDELARQQDVEALIVPRRTMVQDLPIERIRLNPFQARKQFENLEELAEAIKVQGFTSRLRVRPDPFQEGYFQLVYGERRLRAAILLGLVEVPCEIAEHSDEEMIEIGLAENIQRRDLNPIEEAQAFQTFIRERGYSIRSLAGKIGKDKSYVQDRMELLRVPEDVQAMVVQRNDTLRAAREIAKLLSPAERKPLIDGVVEGKLNVQDVRAIIAEQTAQGNIELNQEESFSNAENNQLETATDNHKPETAEIKRTVNSRIKNQKSEPSISRLIERDGRLILTALARWQEKLPGLDEQQQKLLLFYTEQVSTELNTLKGKISD